jgi:hypothetical protein
VLFGARQVKTTIDANSQEVDSTSLAAAAAWLYNTAAGARQGGAHCAMLLSCAGIKPHQLPSGALVGNTT